jgi:hypothetical protein
MSDDEHAAPAFGFAVVGRSQFSTEPDARSRTADHFLEWPPELRFPGDDPLPHPPPMKPHRMKYGKGIDARRTAPYRRYDIRKSQIFGYLEKRFSMVTKELLLRLAHSIVDSAADPSKVSPPGRTQKRIRSGLVLWMEQNSAVVWSYLRTHPQL